jgi:hypothetical protein
VQKLEGEQLPDVAVFEAIDTKIEVADYLARRGLLEDLLDNEREDDRNNEYNGRRAG